ncbi:TPM domain-containing protein [Flavobacterium piscinae]|uniref:TPM domain-containing protein n=1 Tax=Flavobacterium piscinae TaxID=2506424 RepID=A0A4Q1KN74_9FLAO|nr:TPM domain-containing protein [Flavobacterium piscinae]MBC8883301.1 TPM domain-containing protein [Flavobacterium piscinae]RXR31473.1 TPM domain-containing protein [Flavobacterium piscinae]
MSKVEDFLTPAEEQEIVQAIALAEKNTSGEIRVHIENHSDTPPIARAREVFDTLKMYKTQARNGVLFYVGVADHTFAIIGDSGIDDVVESDFWECTKDIVLENFRNKKFKDGLVEGIKRAGERLKEFFPYDSLDTNELSNEISKG